MRKKVFICSPFRGDMEGNARKAASYCRMACEVHSYFCSQRKTALIGFECCVITVR